jgi:hypothetical protein
MINGVGIAVIVSFFDFEQINRHLPVFLLEPVLMEFVIALAGVDQSAAAGEKEEFLAIGDRGEKSFDIRILDGADINPESLLERKAGTVLLAMNEVGRKKSKQQK